MMDDETQGGPARRNALTLDVQQRTGIDEAMIERLVRGFYDRVRADPLIGPVFASKITDWEPHLREMMDFWSSVALMTGRYHGRPMQKHLRLPIDARHFDRWLALFEDTARSLCPPIAAEHFIIRARRIARSFELGVANANGVMLGLGERLHREDLDTAQTAPPRS